MKPVWATRTGTDAATAFLAYSETTGDDAPYLAHDLAGSIVHVAGLHHVGLLEQDDAAALITALQGLGDLELDPALEDVHMNLEARLTAQLGDVGKKLHTGRSRNDQVATCLTLHARQGLVNIAQAAHATLQALIKQAQAHAKTPWVAQTHGQPAQPATLGFLLAAHGFRFAQLTHATLQAFQDTGQSPLGAGAVAGSTLPLDPAFTANLLGLRPLDNALLASGSRDTSLHAIQVAGHVGFMASSLAQDLLDLFGTGHLKLPAGFTTGSSLMPQKRNPDALELIRGHGKSLAAQPAQATALVAGLGLGYMRDLQAIKPLQTTALEQATRMLQLLAQAVDQGTFHAVDGALDAPGITATDAAEALVQCGIPFRTAYEALATAFQAVEAGSSPEAALAGQDLPPAALTAALSTLTADPDRRQTLGGPAPVQVHLQVEELLTRSKALDQDLEAALGAIQIPARLRSTPAQEILA